MLERLVRELKVPKALKFITISFSVSWLFVIITKTRRVFTLFRNFHLLELRIKNFVHLPFR